MVDAVQCPSDKLLEKRQKCPEIRQFKRLRIDADHCPEIGTLKPQTLHQFQYPSAKQYLENSR